MNAQHDVIVIGAGPGGATIAALLADAGLKVSARREERPCRRQGHDAAPARLWLRDVARRRDPRWTVSLRRAARADRPRGRRALEHPAARVSQNGGIVYHTDDGRWLRMDPTRATTRSTPSPRRSSSPRSRCSRFVEMAMAVFALSEDEIDALDETPILDWLNRFDLPAGPLAYIGVMLNMFFLVGPDRIPASEAIRICLRGFMLAGGAFQYWKGGIGRTLEVAAEYVTEHGGTFVTEGEGRADPRRGRSCRRRPHPARGVPGAGRDLQRRHPTDRAQAGRRGALHAGVRRVRPEPRAVVGDRRHPVLPRRARLPARRPRRSATARGGPRDRYEQARPATGPTSRSSTGRPRRCGIPALPRRRQPGRAHRHARRPRSRLADERATRSSASTRRRSRRGRRLGEHIVEQETYTTRSVSNLTRDAVVPGAGGECIGIAQTIEQEGKNKPEPAHASYPASTSSGCDAGGKGVATHQAVDSGFRVAELVLEDLGCGVAADRGPHTRLPARKSRGHRSAVTGRLPGWTSRLGGRSCAATGLRKRFGETQAVDGVSLEIHPGERVGIVGPNGAGKTTTLLMLLGAIEPDEGTVELVGHASPPAGARRWSRSGSPRATSRCPTG